MPKDLTRHQLSSRIAYDQSVPSFLRKLRNQVAGVSNHESDPGPEPELEQEADEDEFGRQRRPRQSDLNEGETLRRDEDREWETWQASSGRPSIPRRPAPDSPGKSDFYAVESNGTGRPSIPERPADDPGSADEDNEDEKPQVVVLKEGKHLSALEVENEKRKAKGLPPLEAISKVESDKASFGSTTNVKINNKKEQHPSSSSQSQSFASIGSGGAKSRSSAMKRKMIASSNIDSDTPNADASSSTTKANSGSQKEKGGTKKAKKQKIGLLSFGDDG